MVASASIGFARSDIDTMTKEEIEEYTAKEIASKTKGTSTNSGRVDVSNAMTLGQSGTNASQNKITVGPSSTSSSTVNSGRVDTSQVMIDKEGLDFIAQGMLERTGGLRDVSSGKNAAGGYNSTVHTLLANDLLGRISGEVAVRGAKTVNTIGSSTSTTNTENSGSVTTQDIGATSGFNSSGTQTINNVGASTTTNESDTFSREDMAGLIIKEKDEQTDKEETKVEAKGGWIVCTELTKQNRMDRSFYAYGLRVFMNYSPAIQAGYYYWAVPMLAHLKAKPYSLLSRVVCKLLCARAEYLAAERGHKRACKTVLGFVSKHLVWGCWLLGHTVAKNYETPESNSLTQGS